MGANLTTTTPWIAYISCDANETGASMEWGESAVGLGLGSSADVTRHLYPGERQRGGLSGE